MYHKIVLLIISEDLPVCHDLLPISLTHSKLLWISDAAVVVALIAIQF
jgi:hypothetical protein